jgi:hypothetical protein
MLTTQSKDSETFRELPPLLVSDVSRLPAGSELNLALLELVPTGPGVIFLVKYTHRELTFRTPGGKDAVAFGVAALEHDVASREVRILFSQVHDTATMKGLTLEGSVKPFGPNKSLERTRER